MKLQPEWVGELVSICSSDDWADAQQPLSWSSVSPMFRRLMPEMAETDDATGYSSAEVRACKAGLDWLARDHPVEFSALAWEFQAWRRSHIERHQDHDALAQTAARLLADFVDRTCGN